ncbi:hypothetical protein NDU88_001129 [Pleurodeles waltl]|uniref:Uncharacterized protein n=1 Tax=Pleurodeles waltl TaxID=8319 RepID=A0AAV7VAW9_PLEWA|nr:hypothetical protein NDU88_001129 [Pleurodeles waltl]
MKQYSAARSGWAEILPWSYELRLKIGARLQEEAWTWLEDRGMALDPYHPPSRSVKRGPRRGHRVGARCTQAAPTAEQASMGRDRACAEVERRVGSPASSVRCVDHLDAASPDLEMEQVRAILGEGPMVTPQSAEDLL